MSQGKTNSPERRYEGFGLNFLVAEEEHSLSCRNTQYRGGPKMTKLSRNGFRMDDMRNRDRENDRTGPRSIFRPLPYARNQKNIPRIAKKPVWGPSLGLLLLIGLLLALGPMGLLDALVETLDCHGVGKRMKLHTCERI